MQSTWVVPKIFFKKNLLVTPWSKIKNTFKIISCAKQNHRCEYRSLVLDREAKWTIIIIFVLNRVRIWRVHQHISTPLNRNPPPPPQRGPSWYTVILDDLTTTNMDPCHYRSLLYSPIEDLWRNRTFTSAQPGTELRKVNVRSESLDQHVSTATLHITYPIDGK